VQVVLSTFVRGNRLGFREDRVAHKEYLDIGCGKKVNETFVSLDYYWHPDLDVCHDATHGLPFADSSFKGVYSEHCIEHLELRQADVVFGEILRVLRPGGTLRIIVPDLELYARRYLALHDGQHSESLPYSELDAVDGLYTPAMSVSRIYKDWGHRFIYDFQTLEALLDRHGFADITRESYRSGRDATMLQDSAEHVKESLYVEASKPSIESTG
jgi:predicted SAM-dependent methyltransferase